MQSTTGALASAGQAIGLVVVGLLAGSLFGIWFGYDFTRYSPAAYLEVHQHAVSGLNDLLPYMGLAAIAATVALAWRSRGRPIVMWSYVVAAIGLAVAGLVTRFGNQPINALVMGWTSESLPPGWEDLRHSWWFWHGVRLAAVSVAFVALISAVFRDRSSSAGLSRSDRAPA